MDLNNLAKVLLELSKDDIEQLTTILKHGKGNKITITPDDDPICLQGFVWSPTLGKCVADVGGLG